jgi:hypothetical protein
LLLLLKLELVRSNLMNKLLKSKYVIEKNLLFSFLCLLDNKVTEN